MINICLFGAGRIARIHAANIAAPGELGLRSVVDVKLEAAQALAKPYAARAGTVFQYFCTERYAASYRLALDHFADVAKHGEPPFITAEDGRRAQIIAEAALRSAGEGRPVAISY